MNKRLLSMLFVASSCIVMFSSSINAETECRAAAEFFNKEAVSLLPKFTRAVVCPVGGDPQESFETVNSSDIPNSLRYTVYWLRKTLQSKWLPEDIGDRLIGLRTSLNGEDAFWVHYQIEDYSIQIASNYGSIFLLIRKRPSETDADEAISQRQMETGVEKVIRDFLLSPERIMEQYVMMTRKGSLIARDPLANGLHGGCCNCWWEMTRCWSDGESFLIVIPKADPHSPISQPQAKPYWFDEMK